MCDDDAAMARPSKYVPARTQAICEALRLGKTRHGAAAIGEIHYCTLLDWIEKYPEFSDEVTRAEAEAEARFTEHLALAAEGGAVVSENVSERFNAQGECIGRSESKTYAAPNVQAITFWLERRRPDNWRKPTERQEISGPDGNPIIAEVRRVIVQNSGD